MAEQGAAKAATPAGGANGATAAAASEPVGEAGAAKTETPANAGAATDRKHLVFMDIDIAGWRAAYNRAVDFVKATNLRYSLTSDNLEELGGSEKNRIRKELYPNDFE